MAILLWPLLDGRVIFSVMYINYWKYGEDENYPIGHNMNLKYMSHVYGQLW
jgi:hypothetical protein